MRAGANFCQQIGMVARWQHYQTSINDVIHNLNRNTGWWHAHRKTCCNAKPCSGICPLRGNLYFYFIFKSGWRKCTSGWHNPPFPLSFTLGTPMTWDLHHVLTWFQWFPCAIPICRNTVYFYSFFLRPASCENHCEDTAQISYLFRPTRTGKWIEIQRSGTHWAKSKTASNLETDGNSGLCLCMGGTDVLDFHFLARNTLFPY